MTTPWFYPDKVGAAPGETVRLFASAPQSPCRLQVTRIGLESRAVATYEDVRVDPHPISEDADRNGCDWPEAFRFTVGADWKTGYYDLELVGPDGASSHHFICVRRGAEAPRAKGVLILSTNTYQAYNSWGGANAYAHVEKLVSGELEPEEARDRAIGRLSRMRPYVQVLLVPPQGAPRLINRETRAMGAMGHPGEPDWLARHQPSPYDGSAGFIDKWEHKFVAWCEANDYELDVVTDQDLEDDSDLLRGYGSVFLVGHSEYWSENARDAVEHFVDEGGKLAILSGNTCYWKVRWEDSGQTLIAHKWKGETDDPLWSEESSRKDATHLWSHPAFERPEATLTGLSFLYGGYHRLGMCAARGSGGFTIYDDRHWALADTDLYYGDVVGGDVPLIGYENDGCPIRFGATGLPEPDGGVGVPSDLKIVGIAPATIAEDSRSPYPPLIPPEQPDVLARVAYGRDDADAVERLMRGHAVMASFERGKGEVFNVGTTEWAHGLAAADPFIEAITHNIMKRFGMTPP
jgi:hypothetical protein